MVAGKKRSPTMPWAAAGLDPKAMIAAGRVAASARRSAKAERAPGAGRSKMDMGPLSMIDEPRARPDVRPFLRDALQGGIRRGGWAERVRAAAARPDPAPEQYQGRVPRRASAPPKGKGPRGR